MVDENATSESEVRLCSCKACGSTAIRTERVVSEAKRTAGVTITFDICQDCGESFARDNDHFFESTESFNGTDIPQEGAAGRAGDGVKPGREYFMAEMGVALLGRSVPSIIVVGAGLSKDYVLIKSRLEPSRVAVTDFDNFAKAPDFVPLDSQEAFDIVIACEVLEHFTDFPRDFGNLFAKRADHGIVIASTNINDGRRLAGVVYPFIRGHTAYHTGAGLLAVARHFGLEVDFRVPEGALANLGLRKRYVIFGKRPELSLVARYFASYPFAPSEKRQQETQVCSEKPTAERTAKRPPAVTASVLDKAAIPPQPRSTSRSTSDRCPACGVAWIRSKVVTCEVGHRRGVTVRFQVCKLCGLALAPTNAHRYEGAKSFSAVSTPGQSMKARVGDGRRPGREYRMAELGIAMLDLAAPSILVVGPGLSRDYELLQKEYPSSRVAVSDIGNFLNATDFVPLDEKEPFDVVVACEVIEHFLDFERDFGNIFAKRAERGLVIASTNISDGSPLKRMVYPFAKGHTAYHSGLSLQLVAHRYGLDVDFRTPAAAIEGSGLRKRYVLFGRREQLSRAALYFSVHPFAPSEQREPLPST